VIHLAGVVSGAAEADFDLGMHTNIDGMRTLLEYGRRHAVPPLVIFSSSLAVFGSDPAIGPVGDVDDDTLPRPQSSYGMMRSPSPAC
jgi:nucleoside-diphosphate-sugar epimerase